MLKAYFDESKHGQKISVCGFVSREDQWHNVSSWCDNFFKSLPIPYLHMAEFVSDKTPKYVDFDYKKRPGAVKAIMTTIRRNVRMAVCVTLDAKDFNVATTANFKSQIGSAYTICATTAVILVGDELRRKGIDWNVDWTFEHGHANQYQLAARLTFLNEVVGREFRIQKFGFSPHTPGVIPEIPLQLADALAYAALQPAQSFKVLQQLHGDNAHGRDILHSYTLDLNPPLISRIWGAVAEVEAYARKVRKLTSKGLALADKISEHGVSDDGVYEVDATAFQEIDSAVRKINEIARSLKIDSRIKLTHTEPGDMPN
jgi:hypothetical protein